MKRFLNILTTLLFSVIIGGAITATTGIAFGAATGGVLASSFIPKNITPGSLAMAVNKEIWVDYIIGNLFKNNEFLNYAIDESQYVLKGSVIHIPQAGAPSGVKRNRKKLPASVTLRSDSDITYVLDEFTTDPRLIRNADEAELSYDKLNSCMSEDMMYLRQVVAEWMLYKWRPEKHFVPTTGDAVAAHISGATGNRAAMTLADLVAAKELMDDQDIPQEGRICLLDNKMYNQLAADLKVNDNRDYSIVLDPKTGKISQLESFNLLKRSSGLISSAADGAVISPDDSKETTACGVASCWQTASVAKALGETKMFDEKDSVTYYGDLYSFLQRMGGRKRRADEKGVIGIRQANA